MTTNNSQHSTLNPQHVVVIGGGLVGWSTAYRLVRAGVTVTVVDRADPGQATAAGAGIIAPGTNVRAAAAYHDLSIAATRDYPALVAELAADGEPETGYETVGALFTAWDDDEAATLPSVLAQLERYRAAGMGNIGAAQLIDGDGAQSLFPPLAAIPAAIYAPAAARVNGRLLRDALRRASERHGVRAVTGSAQPVRSGDRVTAVQIGRETLTPDAVVIAGGAWSSPLGDALGLTLPIFPQRGQIAHLEQPETETTSWPIIHGYHSHYLLSFPRHRVVAGATRESDAGYDVRMTAGGVHEVLSEALRVAPGLAGATIHEIRIGLRPASPDQLPVLGAAPGLTNAYLATGHGPAGLQNGPVSGAAVAALITGAPVPFDLAPFAANRFKGGGT